MRERDEIHAKIVRLTEERDASRAGAGVARNLTMRDDDRRIASEEQDASG